jgi:N utilization substance protein B
MSPEPGGELFDFSNQKVEEDFAQELLRKTLENNERFTELIQPKLKNWDLDRIARLDMILMKMALCELIFFDQIPVKVSINEYIDISKVFSTPKSKDFINGILDSIMHELRERNEIKKTGRGLVE